MGNYLDRYRQYLKRDSAEFSEPFWLPVEIAFDAPAAVNTRRQFFTKTVNDDLLVVGGVTRLIDPFAADTVTRLVPEMDVEIKDANRNLYIRDSAPLYAVFSHIYAPELWHESFVIPRNTVLAIDLTVTRSPTVNVNEPQGITGELVFRCVRFSRREV
jgi:hypothetical protein